MLRHLCLLACLMLAPLAPAAKKPATLEEIQQVRDLERRARLALDYAAECITRARDAYLAGEAEQFHNQLVELRRAVDLAFQALVETGKNPRRHPGPFKRAEISLRKLSNRLESLQHEMSYLDRDQLDPLLKHLANLHDNLLRAIMEGRKL